MTFAPGIHPCIPADDYHSAAGVSKSQLDRIARSPAHLRAYLDGPKEPPTPAMILGTLTHLALFEPHFFGDCVSHYERPEGLTFVSKDGKAWRDARQDKPIITADEADRVRGMIAAIRRHPTAHLILEGGEAEQSVFAAHRETGLLRKGRLDWITRDNQGRPCIVDLKTTDDAAQFERTVAAYRYHVQAAYYTDLLETLGEKEPFFLFIVVEKEPPFGVRIIQLEPETFRIGRALYERNLALYAECQASGKWPCYSEEIETVAIPNYAKRED